MPRIKVSLLAVLAVLTALWLLADSPLPQPFTYFTFRDVFIQYSGVIGIGAMSVAMLLALRPRWLEPLLDGLDKMYRLHKWLGISALVASVLHWWFAQGTKWMVGWGWLARPARGPRREGPQLEGIEGLLRAQRGLAETVGQYAFYAAALLLVLALLRRFPYHLFARTHTLLAPVYLLLVFHAVVLARFPYWGQPLGWVLAPLLAAGTVAAVIALFGGIGARRKVRGAIEALRHYPGLDVVQARVALQPGWPGHAAGQFAFVTSDRREGAHPYTIASAWDPRDPHVTFIAKALGDHTSRLRERLSVGLPVTVEGPYGRFDFEDGVPRQIWIGAGIGITPFVARMQHRAATRHTTVVDLFHPTAVFDPAAIDRLEADALAADVRLHLLVDARDGLLTGDRVRAAVPGWQSASIWFCGPPAFGAALRADFLRHGMPRSHFHQELFHLR